MLVFMGALNGIFWGFTVQQLLDNYCYCYRGTHLPALTPWESVWGGRKHEEEEEEEETDAAVLQRDLIEVCVVLNHTSCVMIFLLL